MKGNALLIFVCDNYTMFLKSMKTHGARKFVVLSILICLITFGLTCDIAMRCQMLSNLYLCSPAGVI